MREVIIQRISQLSELVLAASLQAVGHHNLGSVHPVEEGVRNGKKRLREYIQWSLLEHIVTHESLDQRKHISAISTKPKAARHGAVELNSMALTRNA